VWYVDLAPIIHPGVVPVAVARALGLPDQPGRSTMDTLLRFVRDRQMLMVLDNCEHLLDASAELVIALLGAAPGLTVLATSREPIGVAGEVSWRVPSLSLADEAIELFIDRASLAQTDFTVTDDNTTIVAEICARLDGVPLAIELAAARVRALSLAEIVDGLHDRFPAADRRCAHRGAPPADVARLGGVVACAVKRAGTGLVSQAGGVFGRVRPGRRPRRRRRR
jgi:predicted ATPase